MNTFLVYQSFPGRTTSTEDAYKEPDYSWCLVIVCYCIICLLDAFVCVLVMALRITSLSTNHQHYLAHCKHN